MTLDELNKLDDAALDAMLAELCGWEKLTVEEGWSESVTKTHMAKPGGETIASPPRYTTDRNAIAEVEDSLPSGIRDVTYISNLAKVCGFAMHGPEEWSQLHAGRAAVVMAKPRQRTIAAILALSNQ